MIQEYSVIQEFDGVPFLAEIYARDWDEAEKIAKAMGGVLNGLITDRFEVSDDEMDFYEEYKDRPEMNN